VTRRSLIIAERATVILGAILLIAARPLPRSAPTGPADWTSAGIAASMASPPRDALLPAPLSRPDTARGDTFDAIGSDAPTGTPLLDSGTCQTFVVVGAEGRSVHRWILLDGDGRCSGEPPVLP
jgi:hypothetical protein